MVSHDRRVGGARSTLRETRTSPERTAAIRSEPSPDIDSRAAALLARIEAHDLSAPDDPLGFECRLADDNGWTLGHALAVVREYRRFLVLTQLGSEPASPSDDVDRAWHLHITRTADYERFCRDAFGRFLHHTPAGRGSAEADRHRAMYASTLTRYRTAFGHGAPMAIWPASVDPAGGEHAGAHVASMTLRLPGPLGYAPFLLVVTLASAFAAAVLAHLIGVFDRLHAIPGPAFLHVAVPVVGVLAVAVAGVSRPRGVRGSRDVTDPYEAAWLEGGERRVAATALGVLLHRGVLKLEVQRDLRRTPKSARMLAAAGGPEIAGLHPVERQCLRARVGGAIEFATARRLLARHVGEIERRLLRAGLADDRSSMTLGRGVVLALAWGALVVALERIAHALIVAHPMGFLVLLTVVDVGLLVALALPSSRGSARGRAALADLRAKVRGGPLRSRDTLAAAYSLAVFGAPALMHEPRLAGIELGLAFEGVKTKRSTDGGCGGGCGGGGGGGCGGGCGG